MKLNVVIHEAEEGGYWAEVPSLPGCVSQGETYKEILFNLHEAIKGCLSIDSNEITISANSRIIEIAI